MLVPGVCKCCLGESANAGAMPVFLRQYKDTTFAATDLRIAVDNRRFHTISGLYFQKTSSILHLTSSILLLTSYILLLTSSRFPQLLYDSPHLSGRECLAVRFVARRLQLFPKRGAAANPAHQVIDRCGRNAFGEIHQRQFFLGVCSNSKFIIHNVQFSMFNFQCSMFNERKYSLKSLQPTGN